jgi:hypothetical protein
MKAMKRLTKQAATILLKKDHAILTMKIEKRLKDGLGTPADLYDERSKIELAYILLTEKTIYE